MRTTIDKAGRLVIPRALRVSLGLTQGEVEVTADGAALRVEPVSGHELAQEAGRTVIPSAGIPLSDETVQALRDAGRR
jgi:antitoxin component of MazEF toxin-antitoxin module